jgi:hypothetical protein
MEGVFWVEFENSGIALYKLVRGIKFDIRYIIKGKN